MWLNSGDDNTSFFHKYANYRKNINSIWNIADDRGNMVEGFDSIVGDRVNHFETLFQEDKNLSLPDSMKIAKNFPSFVYVEDNDDLMASVTINKLQVVLVLCKNDKSSGPDGIHVEVYRALFDVLGSDFITGC